MVDWPARPAFDKLGNLKVRIADGRHTTDDRP